MNLTTDELHALLRRKAIGNRNPDLGGISGAPHYSGQTAALESSFSPEPLAALPVQETVAERFLVRVTSVRKRLADEDGLCEKYHVDCLRYCGLIADDNPALTKIEVGQRRCANGEPETIEILIERI